MFMLNILNLIKKEEKNDLKIKKDTNYIYTKNSKHYPPSNREWRNSIYSFNKNTSKLLPILDKIIINIIRSYFNLFSLKREKKIKFFFLRRWMRRVSTNRILVSKAELKHTNDKIVIILYIYNRQAKYYLNKIKKLNTYFIYFLFSIKNFIGGNKMFQRKINKLNKKNLKFLTKTKINKDLILSILRINKIHIYKFEEDLFNYYIKISLTREKLIIYYKQIILLNKLKFNNIYLLSLEKLLKNIYKKKIEFNIVNLKYFYLNTDILTQILAIKLKKRKNRILRVLSRTLSPIKLGNINNLMYLDEYNSHNNNIQNLIIKDIYYQNKTFKDYISKLKKFNTDYLDNRLRLFFNNIKNNKLFNKEDIILNSIKHKAITGVRLEAAGRLTWRITAARAIHKLDYKGNLMNIDSSFLNRPSIILKGNLRSNLQISKIKSKTKIGSFGLKAWINST